MSYKYIFVIIACFVLAFQAPLLAKSQHAVHIVPPGSRLVAPRAFVTLPFTIENSGAVKGVFLPSIDLPKGWSGISSLAPIALEPGESKKKLFTVSVPPTALSTIPYPVKLTIISESDARVMATASVVLRVRRVLGLRLTPKGYPRMEWAGKQVTYGFEIRNLGNGEDIFEFEAHSSRDWKVKTSQERILLGPYEKRVVKVLLIIPRDIRQEQLHVLSFQISSVGARGEGRDISDEAKMRLTVLPVADEKGAIYRELPGSMELELSDINDHTEGVPETRLRFDTAGELTEEYYSRLYFNGTFLSDQDQDQDLDYRFDLSRGERWDLSLGHTYASFTRLIEDLSGEGIAARVHGERLETTLWAGRSDTESSLDDEEAMKESDIYSVGTKVTALMGERGMVGLTSLFMDREHGDRTKGLYGLDGEYRLLGPLTLFGEMAYGFEETESRKIEDIAWLMGSDFNRERVGLGAEYYHGGVDYPGGITDEEGFKLYSRYRLFEPVDLWVDYHRYNDNVDDNPAHSTTETEKIRGGPQFRYGRWPTVNLTWEREKEKSSEISLLTGEERIEESISLGLYKSLSYITLFTRGEWGTERDLLRETRGTTAEYSATASGSLKMFNWGVSYDRNTHRRESNRTTTEKIGYNLGCHLFNVLDANVEYTDEVTRSDGSKTRRDTYDVDLSLNKQLGIGRGQSLSLKFEWDNVTEDNESAWNIGLVWRSQFGTPIPWIKIKGRVRGQLFLDEDGDGKRGVDEKVYEKCKILLDYRHLYTDQKGQFEFPALEPGDYHLDVEIFGLPSGVVPAIALPLLVSLKRGDNIFVDIPLERVGTIEGVIFDDENKNMQREEGEEGLSPIRVVLSKGGKEIRDAFTDKKGRYVITDIKPGDYVVRVDIEYLPRRYIMTTPESIEVDVKFKERVVDINFGAYEKPRRVIKTFFRQKR